MKKRIKISRFLMCFIAVFAVFFAVFSTDIHVAYADNEKTKDDIERELSDAVNELIDGLDMQELQDFLDSLGVEERNVLSIDSIKDALKKLASGEPQAFYETFFNALATTAGRYFLSFLPSLIAIIVICLLKNMLCGLTGDFLNKSTTEVVHIVCYCAVVIVLMTGVVEMISTVNDTINALISFASAIFPVMLTMLSMLGSASAVATYSPLMGVLCGFIMKLVSVVIVPAFVACIVFCVVGNISSAVKLDKLTGLIKSASSWLIGIVFGLFATFLTVQGVTGGVIDKFGFGIAKLAVSSYVPILGGYLSDGLDLLSASVVLVKNALGYTGAITLCAVVMFPIVKVLIFSLALRLASAIIEPIGDTRGAALLSDVAKNVNLLITALAGVAFMFFLMLMLIISSCNMGI